VPFVCNIFFLGFLASACLVGYRGVRSVGACLRAYVHACMVCCASDNAINFVQQQDVDETLMVNPIAKANLTPISFIVSYVHKDLLIFCLVNLESMPWRVKNCKAFCFSKCLMPFFLHNIWRMIMPHVFEKRVKINRFIICVWNVSCHYFFHIYRKMIKDFNFNFWFIARFG
jgi:hypothetical protein